MVESLRKKNLLEQGSLRPTQYGIARVLRSLNPRVDFKELVDQSSYNALTQLLILVVTKLNSMVLSSKSQLIHSSNLAGKPNEFYYACKRHVGEFMGYLAKEN